MKIASYSNEKILERLLNNKSDSNYWTYITELRKRKTKDIYAKSVSLTQSKIVKEKNIGIDVMAQFGYPRLHKEKTLKIYFNLLKTETDISVISSIFYGIGHNNDNLTNKQIDIICNYKRHRSAKIRYSLVFALLAIENIKAIETLIELSSDKDADIRNWSTFGIGAQISTDNEEIRKALWARIDEPGQDVRYEAIFGLATRKDPGIKEVLKNELLKVDDLGSLLLESIEAFEDKDFISLLEQQIAQNKITESINEKWLLDTIEKLKENQ
ncbi:hypothetical protein NAT51_12125 [Flavobacterium amniphilum]|uniref:hypothetical protein n=1 Tax=Flavobacterium amniphilum TaxID=1834035 RepID=UPI00202A8FC8|nr:hypothetical protein [Flavobacterium amniphilum]MCL9806275.1 hypothetical protein [Flavobacterium amniphilum]